VGARKEDCEEVEEGKSGEVTKGRLRRSFWMSTITPGLTESWNPGRKREFLIIAAYSLCSNVDI